MMRNNEQYLRRSRPKNNQYIKVVLQTTKPNRY